MTEKRRSPYAELFEETPPQDRQDAFASLSALKPGAVIAWGYKGGGRRTVVGRESPQRTGLRARVR